MKRIFALFFLVAAALTARANDGVYLGSGNQLIPLQETDITITREVLTLRLLDNGYASVDVLYELDNRGPEKSVLMGFEADAPYNAEPAPADGRHPYISNFCVEMNNEQLPWKTAIVRPHIEKDGLQPIDITKLRNSPDWEDYGRVFVSQKSDSSINYACAYYFNATFRRGRNTVHHTYEYALSYSLGSCFSFAYKLTPAARWASRRIDDFTLRIVAEKTAKHFVIENDSLFNQAEFRIVEGMGKTRPCRQGDARGREVTLRNGTLEWHCQGFRPQGELSIISADVLQDFSHPVLGSFYDRNEGFLKSYTFQQQTATDSLPSLPKEQQRILRNLPYAHRGQVFRDRQLRHYFESLWWYMPDPEWKGSAEDFTTNEQLLIKTLAK